MSHNYPNDILLALKDYINAFLSLGPRYTQTSESDVHVLFKIFIPEIKIKYHDIDLAILYTF